MSEPSPLIRLASNLLRHPQLFDSLGATSAGYCRDLVLYAAWQNQAVTTLHLPDFCRTMGYDRANLLRKATAAEVKEIRDSGWPEEEVAEFSNSLGVALVRLVTHNFIFPARSKESGHKRIEGSKIVQHIDLFKVQKSGTRLEYVLSPEILEQSRDTYQTIHLGDYLSLRTKGGAKRPEGHPDDAARKLMLRLSWKRQYWEYLEATGTFPKNQNPAADNYDELLLVAGLDHLASYAPPKKAASQLRKLLLRVGALPSIRLKPQLTLNKQLGVYEVRWSKMAKGEADAPAPDKYAGPPPAAKAPRAAKRRRPAPVATAPAAVPAKLAKPASPAKDKLKGELTDATNSLRWLESSEAQQAYATRHPEQPELLTQHVQAARLRVREIQQQLVS